MIYRTIIGFIVFLLFNFVSSSNEQIQCQSIGDECDVDNDCCSNLNCLTVKSSSKYFDSREKSACWPLDLKSTTTKRSVDFFSFYNTKQNLFPNSFERQYQRKKLEWDNCRFHEDCGDGYCCYVHFRFRSLPKSFCRPNKSERGCSPISKYRTTHLLEVKPPSNYGQ